MRSEPFNQQELIVTNAKGNWRGVKHFLKWRKWRKHNARAVNDYSKWLHDRGLVYEVRRNRTGEFLIKTVGRMDDERHARVGRYWPHF